ncbi:MAG: peptidoglycan-binding domain-containing protein, partial [Desulfobacteraceae bacterium]
DPQQAARWIEAALRAGSDFSRKEMRNNSDAWTLQFRIALQKRLKNTGVYNGTLDGQFGPETRRAIDAIFGKEL